VLKAHQRPNFKQKVQFIITVYNLALATQV